MSACKRSLALISAKSDEEESKYKKVVTEEMSEKEMKAYEIIKERKDIIMLVRGRAINRSYLIYLKSLIKKKGLERFVKLNLRWIPDIFTLYCYYRASDLYVHTSISEGFSLTILDKKSLIT